MLSIVATVRVKEEKLEEAKTFFKQVAEDVAANEPDTLAYVLHQRRDDPLTVVVYEKYSSNEAFALHSRNLVARGTNYMDLLEGPPEVVLLDEI